MTAAELEKLLAETTPEPWQLCAHLRMPNENGCPCGYRGVLYGRDDYAICQPGHEVIPGEEGLEPPRLPRAEEIANMRLIAMSPTLARKGIAAEKLADVLPDMIRLARSYLSIIPDRRGNKLARIEAAEEALAEWESFQ